MQKIKAPALSKFSFMSCKEAKVVVPILTFLLPRGYESKDSIDSGQKISDFSVCVPGTEYKRINISTRKESCFMEVCHVLVTEKKKICEKANLHHGKEKDWQI